MRAIELHRVVKTFHQGQPNEFTAIRGVDLRIEPRQATVLKGPSGSGKSTLLAMIGCLSRPTSGRITLDGERLSGLPERFMTEVRRRTFGFIFQQF
ncbi:MAG: ATP-binding cassette domain-containing protein, partial [Gammaproteobacteria bacterium]|nr:ATP-binding cassette domain-containing protein [Gammaproteobacteria bacterium]